MSESFAKYRWRHRLLESGGPGFEERGLVPLFPVDFRVGGNAFAAIPVSEDGAEKARFERPVELVRLIGETRRRGTGRGS